MRAWPAAAGRKSPTMPARAGPGAGAACGGGAGAVGGDEGHELVDAGAGDALEHGVAGGVPGAAGGALLAAQPEGALALGVIDVEGPGQRRGSAFVVGREIGADMVERLTAARHHHQPPRRRLLIEAARQPRRNRLGRPVDQFEDDGRAFRSGRRNRGGAGGDAAGERERRRHGNDPDRTATPRNTHTRPRGRRSYCEPMVGRLNP